MSQEGDGLETAQYWERRAADARVKAEVLQQESAAKRLLLRVASTYDALAERARALAAPPNSN
jgi:hypothetical protein